MDLIARAVRFASCKASQLESHIAEDWLGGWTPADIPDLRGKVALVTGGNSGMGFEVVRKLAENGAYVLLVSRDQAKGQEAADKITAEFGKAAKVDVMQCDMTSLGHVVDLAAQVRGNTKKLDLLIHLAGVFYPEPPAGKTADGIEQTLGINYYAPALLTLTLLDLLRATPGSRAVFMSSAIEVIGRLTWHDIKGESYVTSGLLPYANSKLWLTMFARELSRRVPDIDVFAVHPGLVATPLHMKSDPRYPLNLVFKLTTPLLGTNPHRGAVSTLFAATEPSLKGRHFAFFGPSVVPLNLWPTTERPFYRTGRIANDRLTARLFDETQELLHMLLGNSHAPPRVPPVTSSGR